MATIISASNVSVRYNNRTILDEITLGVQEGERIGLVGRNASSLVSSNRNFSGG